MTEQAIKPKSTPLMLIQSVGYGVAMGFVLLSLMSTSPDYSITSISILQCTGASLLVAFFVFLSLFIERQKVILHANIGLTDEEKTKASLHLAIASATLAITMTLFLIGGILLKVLVISYE